MLYIALVISMVVVEIVPPAKWWGHITYVVTWPTHLGKWIKEKVEND